MLLKQLQTIMSWVAAALLLCTAIAGAAYLNYEWQVYVVNRILDERLSHPVIIHTAPHNNDHAL